MSKTTRKITAFEARTHLGEVLDYVRYSKKPCLIERHGKTIAAIIDFQSYQNQRLESQYYQWIETARDQIIQAIDPEKIILFGSAATGRMKAGSDIDFFVLKESSKRRLDRADEILAAVDPEIPLEIHAYTLTEVKNRLEEGDTFLKKVLAEGRVLYEKEKK